MDTATTAFIHGMPKAELHVHLEGCLTPSLVQRLSSRNNVPLPPTLSQLSQTEGYAFHDLTSFLSVYYPAMSVLLTHQDFHDLATDYLSRAASSNILHCELFFDPQAHTSRGVPISTVIEAYSSALALARKATGISCSLILCILRDHTADSAMATLLSALPYKHLIAGVGLDSDERGNPPLKFAEVFSHARSEGFKLTMHCDIDQPNTLTHISQALHDIGVDRIDHGTNIIDSPEMTEFIREKGIGLTCCPISNSVVTKGFKGKEIVSLLRRGVKVTISSDDPAYFRGYMEENMQLMARETDVTLEELVVFQRNAFEISWIELVKKQQFLRRLEEYARKHMPDR